MNGKMKRYKINSKTNCYEWLGETLPNKYPQIKINGKVHDIYRLVAGIFIRSLKVGDRIIHPCDNKKCINPEHINVVPYEENIIYCWDGVKPEDDNYTEEPFSCEDKNPSEWVSTQFDVLEKLSKSYNLSKKQIIELALNNLNEIKEILDSLATK